MSDLNRAIALYVGWKASSSPHEDDSRVLALFEGKRGANLAKRARSIVRELQLIKPDWNRHDLASGSKWAVRKLASRHWGLDREAKAALEWTCSFWWR
jgi:hypothetical protein